MEDIAINHEEIPVQKKPEAFGEDSAGRNNPSYPANIELLMDVALKVTVELGRTRMQLAQVLELQHGSVIELDRLAGDPVDIFVNDRKVARGEVVIVDDKFGVRITEMTPARDGRAGF